MPTLISSYFELASTNCGTVLKRGTGYACGIFFIGLVAAQYAPDPILAL
jgi:hypothetical protein